MVFSRVKNMSTLPNVKSPMLTRPMLNVSGLKMMKHSLHCLVNTSISRICSVLISRQWSPPDLLFFLESGDKKTSHKGHLSRVGLKVLGHPLDESVSWALEFLMMFMMLLSGSISLSKMYLAVLCMYFWVLVQSIRCISQCSS